MLPSQSMKTMIKLFAFLMLVSVPIFFAGAKPDSAPGIKKKSLEIYNITVVKTGTDVKISWETNFRANGSVIMDDYEIAEEMIATRHSITIPFVLEGTPYSFRIVAFSEFYGSAAPHDGSFTF